MKQLWLCLGLVICLCLLLPQNKAAAETADTPSLIISEIKIKNDTNGYNEFIEIYNADVTSLNLNEFTIEYFNTPAPAANDQPIKKSVIADGLLLPTQTIILAANPSQIQGSLQSPFSSLADAGGLVRIRNSADTVQDQIAWTSTSSLAITPVLFLSSTTSNKTQSFMRSLDDQGNPVLINPTWKLAAPTPHSDALLSVPQEDPDPDPTPVQSSPDTTAPVTELQTADTPASTITSPALPLQITEMLPNPAPPASDSTDEFVELYNPNSGPVDLDGYKLQTGNSYSYSYTFPAQTLGSGEYRAFYVADTGALLANSGGRARLLDPSGQIVFETSSYDQADEGKAWAFISGNWQWTLTPTPNAANILTHPTEKSTTKTAAKSKPTSTKKTTKAVSTKKTTSKPKSTKSTASKDSSSNDGLEQTSSIHPGIIAGVGALALGYALYEYRIDIGNRLYQLRRYRETRRAARAKA